jgi:hypothetical protein
MEQAMRFSRDYSRVAISFRDDGEDEEDRDPEMEEEFRSRDWPENSKPFEGGQLEWQQGSDHWSRFIGGRDSGPEWIAKATNVVTYRVWAERELHEDWRGDYYTYDFNPQMIVNVKPTRKSKGERRVEPLGHAETLAEAQKICEDHARENFLG